MTPNGDELLDHWTYPNPPPRASLVRRIVAEFFYCLSDGFGLLADRMVGRD